MSLTLQKQIISFESRKALDKYLFLVFKKFYQTYIMHIYINFENFQ